MRAAEGIVLGLPHLCFDFFNPGREGGERETGGSVPVTLPLMMGARCLASSALCSAWQYTGSSFSRALCDSFLFLLNESYLSSPLEAGIAPWPSAARDGPQAEMPLVSSAMLRRLSCLTISYYSSACVLYDCPFIGFHYLRVTEHRTSGKTVWASHAYFSEASKRR